MLDKTSNRSFLFIKYPASLRLKQWHYDSPQLVGLRQSFARIRYIKTCLTNSREKKNFLSFNFAIGYTKGEMMGMNNRHQALQSY